MFKKILDKFNCEYEYEEFENLYVAILKNDNDNYSFIQFINGLNSYNGGKPIEWIEDKFINTFKSNLPKRYNNIKSGDIKNKVIVVAVFKHMKNPRFEDQIKTICGNSYTNFKDIVQDVDLKDLSKRVYKNKKIRESITDYFDMKIDFEAKKALKELDKPKKKRVKNEKLLPAIGKNELILLCEGDSALGGISAVLGRENKAYYAMFGVPPNAYDIQIKDIAKSKKLLDLKDILGLSFSDEEQKNINYNNIVIATDADLPGFFIRGQLLGLFYKFGKNLFYEEKIKILKTPLLLIKDNKDNIVKWFYDFVDYQNYLKVNKNLSKSNIDYKKGLGSWSAWELDYIIEQEGFDNMLETIVIDDKADIIDSWLNHDKADERKEMLEGFEFSILNM